MNLGETIKLGRHRLMCGDSTNPDHVSSLLMVEKAEMMFTDPPYGVDYRGGHFHSGNPNIKREREALSGDSTPDMYGAFLPVVVPHVDGPCYMFFSDTQALPVYHAVHESGCAVHALIIWNKVNAKYAAMGAQYKQRHEPLLYFKPKKSTLRWCGKGDECTVWDMRRDAENTLHPTQKPVALAYRAIRNHTAQTVFDPFAGSGSTLVAADRLGRTALLMEINPAYCDVIIKRYEQHIAQPQLLETA